MVRIVHAIFYTSVLPAHLLNLLFYLVNRQ